MDTVTAFFFCQSVIRIVCIFCAVSKAVTDFYKPVVLIVFIISGSIVCFCIISGTVFLNGFYRGFSSIFIISILKGVTIYVRYGFYPAKGIIAVGYGSIFVCDVRNSSVCIPFVCCGKGLWTGSAFCDFDFFQSIILVVDIFCYFSGMRGFFYQFSDFVKNLNLKIMKSIYLILFYNLESLLILLMNS